MSRHLTCSLRSPARTSQLFTAGSASWPSRALDTRNSARSPAGAFRDRSTLRLFNSVTIRALKRSKSRTVRDRKSMSVLVAMQRNDRYHTNLAQVRTVVRRSPERVEQWHLAVQAVVLDLPFYRVGGPGVGREN